jgi:CheY-like chemotaxis protein
MTVLPPPRCAEILLVEDNPGDARLVREALDLAGFPHRLHVAANAEEAMSSLARPDHLGDAPAPDLVLLDLNLPGIDGWQILHALKTDPRLRDLPVVVFTSSAHPTDVARAYAARANAYVVKPLDLDDFLATIDQIRRFWLDVATLPSHRSRR